MTRKRKAQAEKSAETKNRIIEAAQRLFDAHGYENVTMKEIAHESQTSIGSIYHHFRDKNEIIMYPYASADSYYKVAYEQLKSESDCGAASAPQVLQGFFVQVQMACISWGDEPLKMVYLHGIKYREQGSMLTHQGRALYHIYQEIIFRCRREGYLKDSYTNDEVFNMSIALSRGLLVEWLLRNGDFDMEAASNKAYGAMLSGIME